MVFPGPSPRPAAEGAQVQRSNERPLDRPPAVAPGSAVADGERVDPLRGLGMPRIPGLSDLLSLLQTQTDALAELPRTLSDLNGTVRELTQATTMARDAVESAQRVA